MLKMNYFSRKNMENIRFSILGIISSLLTKYFFQILILILYFNVPNVTKII